MLMILLFLATAAAKMDPKIVGGSLADIDDWPFIAAIFIFKGSYSGQACGGSLISSQTILTAAHCLVDDASDKQPVSVYSQAMMGHADYKQATMVREIMDYEPHESYDPMANIGDIGLVFLVKPVKFSATVKKVLLMKTISYKKDNLMMVAGWGAVSETDLSITSDLKSMPQTLLARKKCKEYFDGLEGILCAGDLNSPEFPYSGDSGGPLVKAGSHLQMGVVSFRALLYLSNNGLDTTTTVYTSIPYYYNWIERTQYILFKAHCKKPMKPRSSKEVTSDET